MKENGAEKKRTQRKQSMKDKTKKRKMDAQRSEVSGRCKEGTIYQQEYRNQSSKDRNKRIKIDNNSQKK